MIPVPLSVRMLIFIALMLGLCACGSKHGADGRSKPHVVIQNKGSDTLVNLAQAWAEQYKTVAPDVEVEVSGGGSGVGIAALTHGTIDIANASRNMKPDEIEEAKKFTGKTPREFTVGYDAIVVYVHRDNPLEEITFEQLAGIFGEHGKIMNWSDLGVRIPGVKKDRIVRVSRQSSSGTYEFFRDTVLKKGDFKLGSRDMNGSKEVVELVASARTAIGYSGMGYAIPTVKVLKLKPNAQTPAIEPSIANTASRKYPLARSLELYTLGDPQGEVRNYLAWILSDAGQELVRETGFVPVPPEMRAKLPPAS